MITNDHVIFKREAASGCWSLKMSFEHVSSWFLTPAPGQCVAQTLELGRSITLEDHVHFSAVKTPFFLVRLYMNYPPGN